MLTEFQTRNIDHDVGEFQKYGGRIIQTAKHPTVAGDKNSGKWDKTDKFLNSIGWKDPQKGNILHTPDEVREIAQNRNIGVSISDEGSCLVCLDCDADKTEDLHKIAGDPYDAFADMVKRTLVVYTDDPDTLHYKAFFAIRDPETLKTFRTVHASQKDRASTYEVFLGIKTSRYLVIAPSIHGAKLFPIVSNGRDIELLYAREFADLVEFTTGMEIKDEQKTQTSAQTPPQPTNNKKEVGKKAKKK